ncbi:MAG: hypothetical protein FVQ77_07255 [Cytophagales bacterium]|nr:hypothetical protein [Cytophagales bacterium]
MGQLEFVVYAGSEDLEKYINVNYNYSAITQTKPFFTNVDGGAGLFASRYRQSEFGSINQKSIDYIINNYPGLKFK